jgi:hypothetical protein
VMNLKSKSVELFLFMLGQDNSFFQFNISLTLFLFYSVTRCI